MTPENRSHRILAALRATAKLHADLIKTDKQMRALETTELSDATKAYREIVRDADDRSDSLTPEESHEILPQVCDGLREHDEILAANKAAREARAKERKRVDEALAELHKPAPTDDDQPSLPGLEGTQPDADAAATGLEWFTAECRAVVYTALMHSDGKLDAAQVELLAELASLGLEQIEFVLNAAEAVEEPDADALEHEQIAELDASTATRNEERLPI